MYVVVISLKKLAVYTGMTSLSVHNLESPPFRTEDTYIKFLTPSNVKVDPDPAAASFVLDYFHRCASYSTGYRLLLFPIHPYDCWYRPHMHVCLIHRQFVT